MPDYCVFKIYGSGADLSNFFTISKIEYKVPDGWRRVYANDPKINQFLTYTNNGPTVNVDFTKIFTYEGAAGYSSAYSSWTFVWNKRPFSVDMKVFRLEGENRILKTEKDLEFRQNTAYNFEINVTEKLTGLPIEQFNMERFGYQELGLTNIQPNSNTGLNPNTGYTFSIQINGVDRSYSITTGSGTVRYENLIPLLNAKSDPDGAKFVFIMGDIRCVSNVGGLDSKIRLGHGTGPSVFSSLTGFTNFETAVDGISLQRNQVIFQLFQGDKLLVQNQSNVINGLVNFTVLPNWGQVAGIHAGEFRAVIQVNEVNYAAFDNVSSRKSFIFWYFETPQMNLNSLQSETFGKNTGPNFNISTTAGTLYDPNTITMNLTVKDMYSNPIPMVGQPLNVTVKWEGQRDYTKTIYQTYNVSDKGYYALFDYSFNKVGKWTVTFVLEDSTLPEPEPLGFFDPIAPIVVNITVTNRTVKLDLFNGSTGIIPGQASAIYCNVTDMEEIDTNGMHFPLSNWIVNYYFLRWQGTQLERYYIGQSNTNATGIAKYNWIPPIELAGKEVYIYTEVICPDAGLNRLQYVEKTYIMKRGFHLDSLNTEVLVHPKQSTNYFDEPITMDVTLFNEVGNSLLGETVILGIEVQNYSSSKYYTYSMIIGKNNTKFIFNPGNIVGKVILNVSYSGSNVYYAAQNYSTTVTFIKANSTSILSVDPEDYTYQDFEAIPINVYIRDDHTFLPFNDSSSVKLEIFHESDLETPVFTKTNFTLSGSNFTYLDWHVNDTGIFIVNVTYSGGLYHNSSSTNRSVFVDRTQFVLRLTRPAVFAGNDLLFEGIVYYKNNGTPIADKPVIFEFTDRMGNVYILGINNTNSEGKVQLSYPFKSTDFVYLYMVEFGGSIGATSKMTLQHASASDILWNFKIPKSPTEVLVAVDAERVKPQQEVLVTIELQTQGNIPILGEVIEVEIWSDRGFNPEKKEYVFTGESRISFEYRPAEVGKYYIKVLYKGSHILEPNAAFAVFECSDEEKGLFSTQISIQHPMESFFYYISAISIPLGLIGCKFKGKLSKEKRIKFMGLALMFAFIGAEVYHSESLNSSVPSANGTLGSFAIEPTSHLEWLQNPSLPEEDKQRFLNQLGIDSSLISPNSGIDGMDQIQGLDIFKDLLGGKAINLLGSDEEASNNGPNAAAEDVQQVSMGTYGTMPYPIGDILNISFSVLEDSYYLIVVTDININRRVLSMYGTVNKNELQTLFIPISAEKFEVGGSYALELYVYKLGVTEYLARDMRRMTFDVVRGFSDVEVSLPDISLYEDRSVSILLRNNLTSEPLSYQKVSIEVLNEYTNNYEYYMDVVTDKDGWASVPLPRNTARGVVPIRVIYLGNSYFYGFESTPSYTINPIQTYLSLGAAPVHYTDTAKLTALLYDQNGRKLENKNIHFLLLLVNTTVGDYEQIEITESWIDLGNVTTDNQGVAEITFPAVYPEGIYEVAASFQGDSIYGASYTSGDIFEVLKEKVKVTFDETTLMYGNSGVLSATLTDDELNPIAFAPVSFNAYYNHQWHYLGSTNTSTKGKASISKTVYWDEGNYVLRVTKESDKRFEDLVEYGTLTVLPSTTFIDIGLNASEYREELMISARLSALNGTDIYPVAGETLIFYLLNNHQPNNATPEYIPIGFAVTGNDGLASVVWVANLIPDTYQLKVFYPGNQLYAPASAIEESLKILKANVKINASYPPSSPVMDYADFSFKITDHFNKSVGGETLRVKIFNEADESDVVIERDIITDAFGLAYFRWCPGTPGTYIMETQLVSNYFAPSYTRNRVLITRKAVNFNTSINALRYYRGDIASLVGNASITYKYYNGTTEQFPALSVPLLFHIWNESLFMHPVSGFMVPNVPIRHLDDGSSQANGFLGYTGGTQSDAGQFSWKFIMPDEFYGLQAGQYFIRIKVDTTKTGLYEGEGYISFDLVEPTEASVWITRSVPVSLAIAAGRIPSNRDYYVNETERISIQLHDQDGTGIKPHDHFIETFRDLVINIGRERTLYFSLDKFGTCAMYNGSTKNAEDVTNIWNPQYDQLTGIYSFNYIPYLAGVSDIAVLYAGDRFFDPTETSMQRIVYKRPTYFTTFVSHTKDLYRASTPMDWLQRYTEFSTQIIDTIWLTPVAEKTVNTYLNHQLMKSSNGFSINPTITNNDGISFQRWNIDSHIKHGVYRLDLVSIEDRIYLSNTTAPYYLDIWEITSIQTKISSLPNNQFKIEAKFYDQDGIPIKDAYYSIACYGMMRKNTPGGPSRTVYTGVALQGIGDILWDPASVGLGSGEYQISIDYITDNVQKLRSSGSLRTGSLNLPNMGVYKDIVYYDYSMGPAAAFPYTVYSSINPSVYFYNIQEARKEYSIYQSDYFVNTLDGYGFLNARNAYYVWVLNFNELLYYPSLVAKIPAIIAFGNKENALKFIASASDFGATMVEWDMVFPKGNSLSTPAQASSTPLGSNTGMDSLDELPTLTVNDPMQMTLIQYMESTLGVKLEDLFELESSVQGITENDQSIQVPYAAEYIGDQLFTPGSVGSKFRSIFKAMEKNMDEMGLRYIYRLPIRILEYVLGGGKKTIPQPATTTFITEESILSSLTCPFDAPTDYTEIIEQGNLDAYLHGALYYSGGRSLKITGNARAGDNIVLTLKPNLYTSASKITFWIASNDDTNKLLNSTGIKMSLIDSFGRRVSYTIRPSTKPNQQFMKIEVNISDFTADSNYYTLSNFSLPGDIGTQFDLARLVRIQFTVLFEGFLSNGDTLWIDQLEFVERRFVEKTVQNPPQSIRLPFGQWIVMELLENVIVRPIYDALFYLFYRTLGDEAYQFTFEYMLLNVIPTYMIASIGEKPIGDIFQDLISFIWSGLKGIGSGIKDIFTGDIDSNPNIITKLFLKALAKAPWKILSYSKFILAASLAGICNNLPGYFWSIDIYWLVLVTFSVPFTGGGKEVKNPDGTTTKTDPIWKRLIKFGFKKIPLGVELKIVGLAMLVALICALIPGADNIRKIVQHTIWRVKEWMMGKIIGAVNTALMFLLDMGKQAIQSDTFSLFNLIKMSPSQLVSTILDGMLMSILIDFIFEKANSMIRLPWWLKWMFSGLVRLLVKIACAIFFWPMEMSMLPLKIFQGTIVTIVVNEYFKGPIEYLTGLGDQLIDPFAKNILKVSGDMQAGVPA